MLKSGLGGDIPKTGLVQGRKTKRAERNDTPRKKWHSMGAEGEAQSSTAQCFSYGAKPDGKTLNRRSTVFRLALLLGE